MPTPEPVCLGLNYRTAPVEVRERLTCSLPHFRRSSPDPEVWSRVSEAAALATCNRWELYACLDGGVADPRSFLIDLAAQTHGFSAAKLGQHSYFKTGIEAQRHLLRVACGLDSQILGEAQILGQVADALRRSREDGFAGPTLATVFEAAIAAGKRARAETPINTHPASISSVAVALAQKLSGDLRRQRLLVIGLGEMGHLTLRALCARETGEVGVINRTNERAALAAAESGSRAWRWEDLGEAVAWADVIFIATTAHQALLTRALLEDLPHADKGRRRVIVDIAVPRNVEPAVGGLAGVDLVDIDDLQQSLDEGRAARQAAIPQVEAIIAEELAALHRRLQDLAVRPLIADLRRRAEQIREQELARTLRFLGEVDADTLDHLNHFSCALVNKLLHEPTLRLRKQACRQDSAAYFSAARDLFGLEGEEGG